MDKKRYLVGGNWKSNGTVAFVSDIINNTLNKMKFDESKVDVVVLPMIIHVAPSKAMLHSHIHVGVQNLAAADKGAQTGEVKAEQVKDFGVNWALVGHSERRNHNKETDEIVAQKLQRCQEHGIVAIVCVGEHLEEREAGQTHEVLKMQLDAVKHSIKDWTRIVIAYEPVWAIGTGRTATPEQAQEAHEFIRKWVATAASSEPIAQSVRIIYGGSVNDGNAEGLIVQKDIDGFLVGGASITEKFAHIVEIVNKHAP